MLQNDDSLVIHAAPRGYAWSLPGVAVGCCLLLIAWALGMRHSNLLVVLFVLGALLVVGSILWGAMRYYDRKPILVVTPWEITDNRLPGEDRTLSWNAVRSVSRSENLLLEIGKGEELRHRALVLTGLELQPDQVAELIEDRYRQSQAKTS
ncbi:hypothetical protein [Lignipirellula cremea]|uniref:Uncharacterized protein n=1 Tax=Lignipirellula cremea TaxID=2528010 RepID=A0A518E003_9BACT|nr:hypothetical protein [Lignipirellula cremea]QDU97430.1 hypothetical protein Pla8534_52780 [Lignipirellula cremea]